MFNEEKLSKEVFDKLNEADIKFITNPGRLGNVDSVTIIAYQDNNYQIYRVTSSGEVTIIDLLNKYLLWKDMWDNSRDQTFNSKYQYINMGYGNGLMVDHEIYDTFYPYLIEEVKKDSDYTLDDEGNYKVSLNLKNWKNAFINFAHKQM